MIVTDDWLGSAPKANKDRESLLTVGIVKLVVGIDINRSHGPSFAKKLRRVRLVIIGIEIIHTVGGCALHDLFSRRN